MTVRKAQSEWHRVKTTRPRRSVRTSYPKRKREPDSRPANTWVLVLIRMRDEEPQRFKKEMKAKPRLLNLIAAYEEAVKG